MRRKKPNREKQINFAVVSSFEGTISITTDGRLKLFISFSFNLDFLLFAKSKGLFLFPFHYGKALHNNASSI